MSEICSRKVGLWLVRPRGCSKRSEKLLFSYFSVYMGRVRGLLQNKDYTSGNVSSSPLMLLASHTSAFNLSSNNCLIYNTALNHCNDHLLFIFYFQRSLYAPVPASSINAFHEIQLLSLRKCEFH